MIGNPNAALALEELGPVPLQQDFQGQRQWTINMPNLAILWKHPNSSFDWSGIRSSYMMATENDKPYGISIALFGLPYLTNRRKCFSDVKNLLSAGFHRKGHRS